MRANPGVQPMEASTKPRHFVPPGDPPGHRLLMMQPDAVLCRMAARGSDAAYDTLYRRHHRTVYAFVFHLLGGRDCAADAEDIAQDAFARAFAGIRDKRDGSFRHWIMTIARNRAIDHIRAGAPTPVPLHDETVELDPAAAVACASAAAEDRADFASLVTAMSGLPHRQREALVLRELGGMTHAEIAEVLGTTEPAAKQLIKRGRASVGESARRNGVRPRNLRRELKLAAPLLPMATTAGLGAAGATGAVFGGSTLGGSALAGKAAATVLCVAAIGGTTAAVEHSLSASEAGRKFGPAQAAVAGTAAAHAGDGNEPTAAVESAPPDRREQASKRDRRSSARTRHSGDDRHVGAAALPSSAPSDSGSAAAGSDESDGAVPPSVGFGPAGGEDAPRDSGRETGGAAAP